MNGRRQRAAVITDHRQVTGERIFQVTLVVPGRHHDHRLHPERQQVIEQACLVLVVPTSIG
jgi:hypothetical protein